MNSYDKKPVEESMLTLKQYSEFLEGEDMSLEDFSLSIPEKDMIEASLTIHSDSHGSDIDYIHEKLKKVTYNKSGLFAVDDVNICTHGSWFNICVHGYPVTDKIIYNKR